MRERQGVAALTVDCDGNVEATAEARALLGLASDGPLFRKDLLGAVGPSGALESALTEPPAQDFTVELRSGLVLRGARLGDRLLVTVAPRPEDEHLDAMRLAAVGRAAGSIVHELNNAVAIVQGLAGQLATYARMGRLEPDTVLDQASRIRSASARLVRVSTSLRQLTSDDDDAAAEGVCLRKAVEHALGLYGERLRARGIELRVAPATESARVDAPVAKLAQLALILLDEAMRALPQEGERWLTLQVKAGAEPALVVMLPRAATSAADASSFGVRTADALARALGGRFEVSDGESEDGAPVRTLAATLPAGGEQGGVQQAS